MNKLFLTKLTILANLALSLFPLSANAQTQLTDADLTGTYKYATTSVKPYGIHDPSVVFDPKSGQFYVYGSHYAGAKTTNFRSWTGISNYYSGGINYNDAYKAFLSNPERTVKRCLPGSTTEEEVKFPSCDAGAFASIYSTAGKTEWVRGDQWAPDIVYNPVMKKWCYYLSINGDNWASVIVLMTGDSPEGPFKYQGPVVFGGFSNKSYTVGTASKKVNYKDTDLEIVLGTLSSIPGRYTSFPNNKQWGDFWPNCIDPCVFFDEEGEMWMSYGSWSGGIWMLKLDKNTGLRDYTTTYSGTSNTITTQQKSDAYFGKLIAGGAYVSGEGSYIQHIGNYYYLFMSYGFFSPDGGYEMRIFRSEKPTGPYVDASGNDAINTTYQMNYGPRSATNKGMRIFGAYSGWGTQTLGECAHGHNSACQDDKGRTFLVCHSKFVDNETKNNAAHAMRVHQLFLNKYGWLVAAPFVFNGETTTDETIATTQPFSAKDIEGDYHFLLHPYKMDYAKYATSTEKTIHLSADGKISGDYTGTWAYTDEGASYIKLTIGGVTYHGVVTEQTIQGSNASYGNTSSTAKALCFSAVCNTNGASNCGVQVWGYKMQPQYAIAYNYSNLKSSVLKVTNVSSVSKNVQLYDDTEENTILSWESSNPDVITNTGKYNPQEETVELTLTAKLESGNYYWTHDYSSRALAGKAIEGDQTTGLVAYYNFDQKPSVNFYDDTQRITYGRSGTAGTAPTLGSDYERFGNVVHQYFGAQGTNSYSRMPNPLAGNENLEGFSVSLWVKRNDSNQYDALWSFFNGISSSAKGARLFLTGNSYIGFNDDAGNWFDVNHPDTKTVNSIKVGEWHLVTFTYSKENGYMLYVDGSKYFSINLMYKGSAATAADFDKDLVLNFVKSAEYFYLGLGSFWGSADCYFDDLMIYNRELTSEDVKGLSILLNQVNQFDDPTAIESVTIDAADEAIPASKRGIYDLQGRKVANPSKGLYIINGKKQYVK